jgi:pilus assembly protein CpaB
MRVDVLISGLPPGPVNPAEGTKVKTLLQNIEVLSAGTDIQKDAEGKPQQVQVVNLLVTPEQAEVLALASNQTHIQLVLRNPLDTQLAKTTGTAVGNLFSDGVVKPKPVGHRASPPPPARLFLVEIFNGSKRTEAKFGEGEAKQ